MVACYHGVGPPADVVVRQASPVWPVPVRSGAGRHQLAASEHLSRLETLHLLQNVVAPVRTQEVIYHAGAKLVEMLNDNIDRFLYPISATIWILHVQFYTFFPVFSWLFRLGLGLLAVHVLEAS